MNVIKKLATASVVLCSLLMMPSRAHAITSTYGDFSCDLSGVFRTETFYGKNVSLLNDNNSFDKMWFARHAIDFNGDVRYGEKKYDKAVAEFYCNIRNRSIWGDAESIARTTERGVRVVGILGGEHRHGIPLHIFWAREIWMSLDLTNMLKFDIDGAHSLTLGAFPFELGRGIALGSAFTVGPEFLGYYFETAIDQYAFGACFSGDIIKDILTYDLYCAILDNKADTLANTTARIYGQEYGRFETPARGFGSVNSLIAARLFWTLFENDALGKCTLEPYGLVNHAPEQKVEFIADASSRLGTFGLACEYLGDRCEFGFDYAFNIGNQRVKGWDRNQSDLENRNGQVIVVNSHVVDQDGNKVPFVQGSAAQLLIDPINKQQQAESLNGQKIADLPGGVGFITTPITLINKNNRYRDPYSNKYEGWMFVIDGSCYVYKKDLRVALTAGYTSGDENPNLMTSDQQYGGFIPLQEVYSGKRVKSAFLLGSAGKVGRPLSQPNSNQAPSRFATIVSNFTNLVFWGTGLEWKPCDVHNAFSVKPNLLFFWVDKRIHAFDAQTKKESERFASNYLGTEMNIFMDYYIYKSLKLFCVSSVFFPGGHFADIKGKPLNADQARELNRLSVTTLDPNRIPNIGDNTAYTFNVGLEFKF